MKNRILPASLRFRDLLVLLLLVAVTACAAPPVETEPKEKDWVVLFDGASLDGWIPKITGYPAGENTANTFRVDDGLLQVRYDRYRAFDGRFGHLFYETPYSHYILRVEYRFRDGQAAGGPEWALRNSGVMFHAQSPESMTLDQQFPTSLEAQFLGGTGEGERPTLNLCTPGTNVMIDGALDTRHCIESSSPTYHGDRWVAAELIVLGDSLVHHVVNGDTVMTYTQPQLEAGVTLPPDAGMLLDGDRVVGGYIALQAESHPVDFRKVELLNLKGCTDPEAINYRAHYIASDDSACRY